MQTAFYGDSLHEMSNPIFLEKNKKNISKCRLLRILPSMLGIEILPAIVLMLV